MTFDGEPPNAPNYNLQSEIRGKQSSEIFCSSQNQGLNGQQQSQNFPKMEFLPGTRFPGGKIGIKPFSNVILNDFKVLVDK